MTTNDSPDLAIWNYMHRGMRVSFDRLERTLVVAGLPDRARLAGIQRWYELLMQTIEEHHGVEDTIFFPALAARCPAFEQIEERLGDDHHRLDDGLERLRVALGVLAGEPSEAARAEAVDATRSVSHLLNGHLDVEDERVVPLFVELFDRESYEVLSKAAEKGGSLKLAAFVVPWIVESTPADERAEALRVAPPIMRLVNLLCRRWYGRLSACLVPPRQPVRVSGDALPTPTLTARS